MMSTALLGLVFLVVGFAAMFLMYHLWRYPFDKDRRVSSAPRWAMRTHRGLGYAFVLIYIVIMWRMVPRLWEYQVEFPARTTAHIILGFTVGFLLLIKIAIMRFFRHFEEWMPVLGTAIMLGTVLLLGLSLPYVLQERALAAGAPGGDVLSDQSRSRVMTLLPQAGLPSAVPLTSLATAAALTRGRHVLIESCVKCHDLKTILDKPRTPAGWWSTVERMAEKPALFAPMTDLEMYEVTAYLIAITPDLQRASKRRYQDELAREDAIDRSLEPGETTGTTTGSAPAASTAGSGTGSAGSGTGSASPAGSTSTSGSGAVARGEAVAGAGSLPGAGSDTSTKPVPAPLDLGKAKAAYERVCSQCHELSDVDKAPPRTRAGSRSLIARMIKENEAEMTAQEIRLITAWLNARFVDKTR